MKALASVLNPWLSGIPNMTLRMYGSGQKNVSVPLK